MNLFGFHVTNIGAKTEIALAILAFIVSILFSALYDTEDPPKEKERVLWGLAGSLAFMVLFVVGSTVLAAPGTSLLGYEVVTWGSLGLAGACVAAMYPAVMRNHYLWAVPLVWLAGANALVGFATWASIADPGWAKRFTAGMYISMYVLLVPATLVCLMVAGIAVYHKISERRNPTKPPGPTGPTDPW